jgi:transcription elongation factor Elf1
VKPSVARRLRGTTELISNPGLTETVVCGKCGQRFAIRNDQGSPDMELARKQASWVAEQLVWDHIQERKHSGTIALPSL